MSQSVSVVVHYQRYYISTHVRCQGYVRRLGQSNDQYFSTTRHRFQAVLGRNRSTNESSHLFHTCPHSSSENLKPPKLPGTVHFHISGGEAELVVKPYSVETVKEDFESYVCDKPVGESSIPVGCAEL